MEFIKITEQPSLYDDLDKKSVKEILEDINTEDHKVADAVQKAIPQIEKLVTLIIPRVKKGGRIFYMGAGTSGRLGVLDASEIPPTFGMPPTVVIGLIAGGDTALRNPVENAEDDMSRGWEELLQLCTGNGQLIIQGPHRILIFNRHMTLRHDSTGIHFLHHAHDGYTAFRMPFDDRLMNRCSASQLWQQRCMHID